tara:strand:- start:366 stop:737 length:372 start_codon:yes stop_codon:yes gene_type:complete
MNHKAIIFVIVAVFLNVIAQYLLKFSASMRDPIDSGYINVINGLLKIVFTPACILGLGAGFMASMFWILALNKLPLTMVYPFTALGFVAVMSVGFIVFNEPFTLSKFSGMCLILLGIAFITQS